MLELVVRSPCQGGPKGTRLGQVVSQGQVIASRGEWKRTGKGVVCVCGVFDLLHPGHIRLLEQARSLGDIVVVALQSDAGVRAAAAFQGDSSGDQTPDNIPRPVTPASERAEILAALAAADYVVEFDEPSPAGFLARLLPDTLVEGAEPGAPAASDSEGEALRRVGCRLVRIPLEPGYSTSRLIQRIAGLGA